MSYERSPRLDWSIAKRFKRGQSMVLWPRFPGFPHLFDDHVLVFFKKAVVNGKRDRARSRLLGNGKGALHRQFMKIRLAMHGVGSNSRRDPRLGEAGHQ